MKSLLLATGEQNKLSPLTNDIPSPMVPIANRPAMIYAVELLARSGIGDICVNLYHLGATIEAYFDNGQRWNLSLNYLLQSRALGSAGAIKRAQRFLTETFLVLPADAIIDLDIEAAIHFHRAHGSLATMILTEKESTHLSTSNMVHLDTDCRILIDGSVETTLPSCTSTGAYIFEPEIFEYIPDNVPYDCYSQLIPSLIQAEKRVYGYQMDGYWNPLDSFETYQSAQSVFLHSLLDAAPQTEQPTPRYPYIEGREVSKGVWSSINAQIHPSVHITPPVCIGEGCQIGRDVELGPNVVIGEKSMIDAGVTIQNSTVLNHSYIGKRLNVQWRVINKTLLIDTQTDESTEIVDQLLLDEANPTIVLQMMRNGLERLCAFVLILLLLPLLVLIGLVIWSTSGMPIIRRSPRVGKRPTVRYMSRQTSPQTFQLYRFRTQLSGRAPNWFGEWLERWELHRIPELWNVVCNDMGLVGVKPLTPREAALIQEEWQQKRNECQAGFTGLWYTQAVPASDFSDICIADTYQAAMHTWRDDLRQLWRTPAAWLHNAQQQQPKIETIRISNKLPADPTTRGLSTPHMGKDL